MKILCCGDQHVTDHRPVNRTDDYFKTVLNKFEQECDIAVEEGCLCVVLPGDVFDTHKETHEVVQKVVDITLNHSNLIFLCVAGQHDQKYHNTNLSGTAFASFLQHQNIRILDRFPYEFHDAVFYGASWKDEIPEVINPNKFNILVIHKMIVDDKLWAAQENFTWANHMLLSHKFDLIISGDNHKQFFVNKGKKNLLNLGTMMRNTTGTVDHHPAVAVFDTETRTADIIDLDYKPIADVMQIDKVEVEKERNQKRDEFEADLKSAQEIKLSFVDALDDYILTNLVDPAIHKIIKDCMEGA